MSDNRNLSGEEKRALLKEEYKKELKLRREFLDKVEQKRKTAGAEKALADVLGLTESNPLLGEDTDHWIGKLNQGSATAEAKIDMILEQFRGETAAQAPVPSGGLEGIPPNPNADPLPSTKTLGDMVVSTGPDSPTTSATDPTTASDEPAKPRKTLGDSVS
jgi:hypothetical protein